MYTFNLYLWIANAVLWGVNVVVLGRGALVLTAGCIVVGFLAYRMARRASEDRIAQRHAQRSRVASNLNRRSR